MKTPVNLNGDMRGFIHVLLALAVLIPQATLLSAVPLNLALSPSEKISCKHCGCGGVSHCCIEKKGSDSKQPVYPFSRVPHALEQQLFLDVSAIEIASPGDCSAEPRSFGKAQTANASLPIYLRYCTFLI